MRIKLIKSCFWLRNSSVIALFSLKILSGNRYSEDAFICTCLIAYSHTNLVFSAGHLIKTQNKLKLRLQPKRMMMPALPHHRTILL